MAFTFKRLALSGLVFLSIVSFATDRAYTLEDLKHLADSNSWKELLEHAEDVAPASRNAQWNTWVEKSATAEVKSMPNGGMKAYRAWVLASRYPFLAQGKEFVALRNGLTLEAYEGCFEYSDTGDFCTQGLKEYVSAHPDKAGEAARIVSLKLNIVGALPFYSEAAKTQKVAICKEEPLHRAVVAGFSQPDAKPLGLARGLASVCARESKEALLAALDQGGSYFSENACGFLLEQKWLSGLREKKCRRLAKQ
ncbi:hypothetical protein K2X33_09160 [bacterium]|nr:hypothetical protein [bacterium]